MYFLQPGKRADRRTPTEGRRLLFQYAAVACLLVLGVSAVFRGAAPILIHMPFNYTESVRAQVVDSRFEPVAGWQGFFRSRAVFRYRYLQHGELFLGSAYRPSGKRTEAVRRYLPGAVIDVFVDPDHPTRAMVHPGTTARDLVAPGIGSILLVLGFALVARR